jgi:hypothetical protein
VIPAQLFSDSKPRRAYFVVRMDINAWFILLTSLCIRIQAL